MRIIFSMIKLIILTLILGFTLTSTPSFAAMECYKDDDCASEGSGYECITRRTSCEKSPTCMEKVCVKKKEDNSAKIECEKNAGKWDANANVKCLMPSK